MRPPVRCLAALLLLGACARAPLPPEPASADAPVRHALAAAPPALAPAVARAEAAIKALRERLSVRLGAALASTGPAGAVGICRGEAAAIARSVTAQTGVDVGRSGIRTRNVSTPPEWTTRLLEESAGRRADEIPPVVLDLGAQVVVVRPIALGAACLACHGGPERIAPEVSAAIAASYALDRVVGFSEGELAGFVWAAAEK
jgi:hypothetical protein